MDRGVVAGVDRVDALWDEGLNEAVLREAVLRGERLRDSATPLDPPGRAGFDAWAEATRALRELLLPHGWRPRDEQNLSLVVSPSGKHAILIVAGDRATGFEGEQPPQPRRPRGDATVYALRRSQLALFPEHALPRLPGGPVIWFLLVHRLGQEVRAELSLPEAIDDNGFITEWRERHCLGAMPLRPGARRRLQKSWGRTPEPLPLFS